MTGGFEVAVRERLEIEAKDIISRYPRSRSALLPMLHLVQAEEGYVSASGIEFCADMLELSTAEVAGVVTFYTMYRRRPGGTYTVGVCTNTLCAVLGGDEIFAKLKEHLGVGHDETTDDAAITLQHLECNAACDYAPVMMVNWEFFDNQTPETAIRLVDDLRAGNEVRPTRGPRLCTFAEVSRVLAGFPDGLADEGPSAGPATLVGLHLARERGESAPAVEGRDDRASAAREDRGESSDDRGRGNQSDAARLSEEPAAVSEPVVASEPVAAKKAAATRAGAKKAASPREPAKKTAKKRSVKKVAPPKTDGGDTAEAEVRTAGAASSAHDAGVSTAQSDPSNEAAPGKDHE